MRFFKKIKCDICDREFSRQEDVMNHMQIMHGKDQMYDCKECNVCFSSMEEMRSHLQKKHSYKGNV